MSSSAMHAKWGTLVGSADVRLNEDGLGASENVSYLSY